VDKHPFDLDDKDVTRLVARAGGGVKFDAEKPRVDLLPSFPLICVANVLGMGARKYSAHNWRSGFQHGRLYAAAMRHLLAYNDGEDIDPESGLHHIDHALCELMFLRQMIRDKPELDDRYKSDVRS